ncbi:MAG: DUF2179 domain-containing protein [Chloroflexota bacterium]|nr:MAG: DUF2179 domain-containing protein [Chloroflexota bacterium]
MELVLSPEAWLSAGLIFLLRVTDMSLDTLRVLFVMRGRKAIAWILGFFQAVVYVIAIASVLRDLTNPLNIIGYAAGFATGVVLGMAIEERLAIGHVHMRIISSHRGTGVAERLRLEGYAVTEVPARGKDGMVTMLNCSVLRKDVKKIGLMVNEVDEEAFITSEEIRPIRRGFWRA